MKTTTTAHAIAMGTRWSRMSNPTAMNAPVMMPMIPITQFPNLNSLRYLFTLPHRIAVDNPCRMPGSLSEYVVVPGQGPVDLLEIHTLQRHRVERYRMGQDHSP